jgi:hypothetical protein
MPDAQEIDLDGDTEVVLRELMNQGTATSDSSICHDNIDSAQFSEPNLHRFGHLGKVPSVGTNWNHAPAKPFDHPHCVVQIING